MGSRHDSCVLGSLRRIPRIVGADRNYVGYYYLRWRRSISSRNSGRGLEPAGQRGCPSIGIDRGHPISHPGNANPPPAIRREHRRPGFAFQRRNRPRRDRILAIATAIRDPLSVTRA